jgi:hypothetical protein
VTLVCCTPRNSGNKSIIMPKFNFVLNAQKLGTFDCGFIVIAGDDMGQAYNTAFFVLLIGSVFVRHDRPT